VTERIPAITWYENDSPLYWVDEKGFSFPIRGEASIPLAVYANGEPPRPLGYQTAQEADQAEASAELAAAAAPAGPAPSVDPQFVDMVLKLRAVIPAGTPLLYDAENGVGWT